MTSLRSVTADRADYAASPALWRPEDVLAATIPIVLGLAAWAIAWFQASGQASYGKQIGWVDLAVAGLIVTTASQIAWLLRGRRAVGEMRRQLLRIRLVQGAVPALPLAAITVAGMSPDLVVAGPESSRFHRADCAMTRNRNWPTAHRTDYLAAGLKPCGLCQP